MRVDLLSHDSKLLADNPLGDSARRDLIVLLPPSYDSAATRRYPVVLILSGFGGNGWQLAYNRSAFVTPFPQRLGEAMNRGEVGEAILVLPDCFTRYGGSQYLDSSAIGRYQSYLVDELFPFVDARYRTIPAKEARGVVGKSSGGYGALLLAMERPDAVAAIGAHAADGAFELSYLAELPQTVLTLQRQGGLPAFLSWFEQQPSPSRAAFTAMSHLCCSAAFSPSAVGPYGFGQGFDFPLDIKTGALRQEIWARWLARDPVRLVDSAAAKGALAGLRTLFLDAGRSDEFNLQLATRQLAAKLTLYQIGHVHEEFDGGHFATQHRYLRSLAVVNAALQHE